MDAMKRQMRYAAESHDTDVSVFIDLRVPGARQRVTFALDKREVGRIRKYFANWWGVAIWVLAWLLGFQSCYECFCSLGNTVHSGQATRVKMTT
jgi:hypothetical protein